MKKLAVTYDNGLIFQHFGHTEQVIIYTIEDAKIVSSEIVSTEGHGHGAMAAFLKGLGVDALVCGGIGGGAVNAVEAAGIELYSGYEGLAQSAAEAYICGALEKCTCPSCHEHGEGHECTCHCHDD